jgi:hypothetical protein
MTNLQPLDFYANYEAELSSWFLQHINRFLGLLPVLPGLWVGSGTRLSIDCNYLTVAQFEACKCKVPINQECDEEQNWNWMQTYSYPIPANNNHVYSSYTMQIPWYWMSYPTQLVLRGSCFKATCAAPSSSPGPRGHSYITKLRTYIPKPYTLNPKPEL